MLKTTTSFIALAVAAGVIVAGPAQAQDASSAATSGGTGEAANQGGLTDIIVTATRRDSNLQKTPIAVSAVDAQFIKQASPRDIRDLAAFVPNFSASSQAGFSAASFAMRGVGQNNIIIYFEPPVAVLIDDFVVPSVQSQLLDTFDIAQLEVLRGPQGTLFGRNTTGGAVVVRTKRPEIGVSSAEFRASYGSFDTKRLQGAVNVPIADYLAMRIVGSYEESGGYFHDRAAFGPLQSFVPSKWSGLSGQGNGERLGGGKMLNGRAKILFDNASGVKALLQYELVRNRIDSTPEVSETPIGDSRFLFNLLNAGATTGDPLDRGTVTNRNGPFLRVDQGQVVDVDGVYFNLDADVGIGTVTYVADFWKERQKIGSSYPGVTPIAPDGEILSLFDSQRNSKRRTIQQELRFASEFSGPFNVVAGLFYQNDRIVLCQNNMVGFLDLVGAPTPYGAWNDTPYVTCNRQRSNAYAAYAEGNYNITDKLKLTVGGRYSSETKVWQGRQEVFAEELKGGVDPTFTWRQLGNLLDFADFQRFPAGVVEIKKTWSRPTWRASLAYQANRDLLAYASYSRGFKSGGFNDTIGTFAPYGNDLAAFREAASPTNPEKADSFEAGLKSEMFDRRLRLNLAAFYVKYGQLQRRIVVPLTVNGTPNQVSRFFNAATATVKGIEAETIVLAAEGLTLRGVLGFQDGKYDDFKVQIPAGYNLALAPLDRTPKWQWTIGANYSRPISSTLKFVLNGDVNYTSRNLYSQSLDRLEDNTFVNARTLVNASVTLSTLDDRYFARLIGRNLTDKRYKTANITTGGLYNFGNYGPPRFFGIELGAAFGGK